MRKTAFLYKDLTDKIIRGFYNVYNGLGSGFLESVYENALMIEFEALKLNVENQKKLNVYYHNVQVGEFRADIVVDNKVLIEIKALNRLLPVHEAQLINYLKATGIRIGLLVNFGERIEFKRIIF